MGDTLAALRRRIKNAEDLRAVVKTMKAMSAASITQFEQAVDALQEYSRAVELALSLSLRDSDLSRTFLPPAGRVATPRSGIVVLGSDQGMVGQFNEHVAELAGVEISAAIEPPVLWVVGERTQARLENMGHRVELRFPTPQSVEAIAPLVSQLLFEIEKRHTDHGVGEVKLCHNAPLMRSNYETKWVRLLPFDRSWRERLTKVAWPGKQVPEVIDHGDAAEASLVREHLFVSLYQSCAASCAAENAARLAAMLRAEKNIDDRRRALDLEHNHQRQSMIDEELFDLISGFEALSERGE